MNLQCPLISYNVGTLSHLLPFHIIKVLMFKTSELSIDETFDSDDMCMFL